MFFHIYNLAIDAMNIQAGSQRLPRSRRALAPQGRAAIAQGKSASGGRSPGKETDFDNVALKGRAEPRAPFQG